jgi:hypothetical protein
MSDNIDTRITPALHPDNVKQIDGYTEETALVLGSTETALSECYEGLRAIFAAKEAAARNPTLNEAAQLIQVDDFAQKRLNKITRSFDAELARLDKAIASLESDLNQPVTARASAALATEIRAHAKSMKTGERQAFIQQAIDKGDEVSATALLGAPAYLSGMTADMQKTLLRYWHAKQSPEKAARLKVMQGAKTLIEKNAPLAFPAVAKAVGFISDPKSQRKIYAKELREARNAAEQPFKDVA